MQNYQVSLRTKSRKIWVSLKLLKVKFFLNCYLGSSDFFGVNHYTTSLVGWCQAGTNGCDWGYYQTRCSNWPTAGSSWLASNPYGERFSNINRVVNNDLGRFDRLIIYRYGARMKIIVVLGYRGRGAPNRLYCRREHFNVIKHFFKSILVIILQNQNKAFDV